MARALVREHAGLVPRHCAHDAIVRGPCIRAPRQGMGGVERSAGRMKRGLVMCACFLGAIGDGAAHGRGGVPMS